MMYTKFNILNHAYIFLVEIILIFLATNVYIIIIGELEYVSVDVLEALSHVSNKRGHYCCFSYLVIKN